jgi:hypothetical protein
MQKTLLATKVLIAVGATVAALAAGCTGSGHNEPAAQSGDSSTPKGEKAVQYTCPMHPEVVQNKLGDCQCGMKLVVKN